MDPRVDRFFDRATRWQEELTALRSILNDCPLDEALKWGKPCYSAGGDNIAIIQPMKSHLCLMFFRGALMKDPVGVLKKPGKNSRVGKRIEFTSAAQVEDLADVVRAYVDEAIAIAEAGLQVETPDQLELVAELQERLDRDPALQAAFEALTPGRQREYNLYISGAKQSATRARRVEKYVDKILAGKGFRD